MKVSPFRFVLFRSVLLFFLFLLANTNRATAQETDPPKTFAGPPPLHLLPGSQHPEIRLWQNGAPGSEEKTESERYRVLGDRLILSNIHNPSITPYIPPARVATGAAVVVIPGGGFSSNWITHEGYRVAAWLVGRGIASFVLKYRLEKDVGSSYTTMDHSLADVQRAIRTVRSRATEWSVDPERVGVIGFSAGGVLAGLAGTHYDDPAGSPVDAIDKLSAKPAFLGLIYGTPFRPSKSWEAEVSEAIPPVFLLAGENDDYAANYPDVYKQLKAVGISTELHIYAGEAHGFGIQPENSRAVAGWIDRFYDWLFSLGML